MQEFGKATLRGADVQTEAVNRMQDPEHRLTMALETLERSFAKPEIIDALNDLSTYLPGVATAFGNFMKFAVKNPMLSGALGLGASAAVGAAKGIGGKFLESRSDEWGSFIKASAKSADVFGEKLGQAHKLGGISMATPYGARACWRASPSPRPWRRKPSTSRSARTLRPRAIYRSPVRAPAQ
jgi:hypothetical protein